MSIGATEFITLRFAVRLERYHGQMRLKKQIYALGPAFVLLVSLLVTALVTWQLWVTVEARDHERFLREVARTQSQVVDGLETDIALLRDAARLFTTRQRVTREVFGDYVERIDLTHSPGIQALGWSQRVPAAEKDALVQRMREQGAGTFRIWPEYERSEYHAILYLEPAPRRNQSAYGYDMYTEPLRRAAMQQARDKGAPALSGRLGQAQKFDEGWADLFIFVPVYQGDRVPEAVAQRRAKLLGFVFSPLRVDELIAGIIRGEQPRQVAVDVFDGLQADSSALLYRSPPAAGGGTYSPHFSTRATIEVGGRPWTLAFADEPEFERLSDRRLVPIALAGGVLVSLLLAGTTWAEVMARKAADEIAARLRQSREERAELLAREQALRARAEAANRAKDEFLATVSHELRTPLNAVLGWTQTLQSGEADKDVVLRALAQIEHSAKAQARLIDDLLNVSNIIAGRTRLEMRPMRLIAVVEAAIESLRPAIQAKDIRLERRLDPAADAVPGDAARLQQVIWNLLSNAVKFTPRGGQVRLSLARVDSQVALTVADNGEGIGAEFLPYVFDRFSQADASSKRRHGGLGLGLAIVRHLVELHGGTVEAHSAGEGQGASFTVRLPLPALRPAAAPTPGVATEAAGARRPELTGLRILSVDDDRNGREMLHEALERAGASVISAGCATEALAALKQFRPDVLVSDIGLPGEDGYDLLRRVRALPADQGGATPAVALTGYAREQDRAESMNAGYHGFIAKPVDLGELIAMIARLAPRP